MSEPIGRPVPSHLNGFSVKVNVKLMVAGSDAGSAEVGDELVAGDPTDAAVVADNAVAAVTRCVAIGVDGVGGFAVAQPTNSTTIDKARASGVRARCIRTGLIELVVMEVLVPFHYAICDTKNVVVIPLVAPCAVTGTVRPMSLATHCQARARVPFGCAAPERRPTTVGSVDENEIVSPAEAP